MCADARCTGRAGPVYREEVHAGVEQVGACIRENRTGTFRCVRYKLVSTDANVYQADRNGQVGGDVGRGWECG